MNKKLNITAAEYQHKIRQQAKARTNRFRQAQEERGYKNISVYLSESFVQELDRLSTEQGLNRQDAMDYIFGIYQDNVNSSVTSNVTLAEDKKAETPVNPDALEVGPDNFDKKAMLSMMENGRAGGKSWPEIAKTLNDNGFHTARGEAWTKSNAQAFFSRNI